MLSIMYAHDSVSHILIEHGADIKATFPFVYHNCTALHMAAAMGSAGIVELLLKKGMDVDTQDTWLQTPLHWAMKTMRQRFGNRDPKWARTVGMLLRNQANIESKDIRGRTPRSLATPRQNEVIDSLLYGGRGVRVALGELGIYNRQNTVGPKARDLKSEAGYFGFKDKENFGKKVNPKNFW